MGTRTPATGLSQTAQLAIWTPWTGPVQDTASRAGGDKSAISNILVWLSLGPPASSRMRSWPLEIASAVSSNAACWAYLIPSHRLI